MPLLAFVAGIGIVIRVPVILVTAYVLTAVVVAPFALHISRALPSLLANTALVDPDVRFYPIDAWEAIAQQADGIAATFAPAMLGLAAPLGSVSGIMDATLPSHAVAAAIVIYAALWVFLWGGVLTAFAGGERDWRSFTRGCLHFAGPLSRLTAVALGVYLVLFLGLHPLFFGVVFDGLAATASERSAFVLRLGLYALFGLLLVLCSLILDYARIELVVHTRRRVRDAARDAWQFIRKYPGAVGTLAALSAGLVAAVFAGYAAFELYTGGAPRPWSAIAIGQAYIIGRLGARLMSAAAQVKLAERLR